MWLCNKLKETERGYRKGVLFLFLCTFAENIDMNHKIAPSLLAADFLHLEQEIEMINNSDADWLHMDIMDGVFVPNISFGFPVIDAIKPVLKKPMDVHLMVVEPQKFIHDIAQSGAYLMNVHYEACTHLHRTIYGIKQEGMKAGVTLNPHTPISLLEDIIQDVDMVLLMSVNPGFGGQPFIEHSVEKTARLKDMINRKGLHTLIEVDGGVNKETAKRLLTAGADVLVTGSYIFKAPNPQHAIKELKDL
ncbi:ribulose-phosphate 3-epimerase [Bacteroidia bacterium]|nr:ribulose-phosphate 3-epimerase [Bacteroidia bacterium]